MFDMINQFVFKSFVMIKMEKMFFSLLSFCDFTRKSYVVGTEKKKWAQWLLSMVLLLVTVPSLGQSTRINRLKFKVTSASEAALVDGYRATGDIVIPEYVTIKKKRYKVTSIGDWAFFQYKDGNLDRYGVPSGNSSAIESVIIPNSVTSIGNYAFYNCYLLSSISLSDNLVSIGDDAFSSCRRLKNITLPNSVTSIGQGAFSSSGIESIIIPDGVTCLSLLLFFHCPLESIILPNSITVIDSYVFDGCERLRVITLPNSVRKIGREIFDGCENLKKIVVPDSMPEIGMEKYNVFWGLSKPPIIVDHTGRCPDWVINNVISNPEFYNSAWLSWAKEQKEHQRNVAFRKKVSKDPMVKQSLFPMCVNGKWGYQDAKGEIIVPCEYDSVSGYERGDRYPYAAHKDGKITLYHGENHGPKYSKFSEYKKVTVVDDYIPIAKYWKLQSRDLDANPLLEIQQICKDFGEWGVDDCFSGDLDEAFVGLDMDNVSYDDHVFENDEYVYIIVKKLSNNKWGVIEPFDYYKCDDGKNKGLFYDSITGFSRILPSDGGVKVPFIYDSITFVKGDKSKVELYNAKTGKRKTISLIE